MLQRGGPQITQMDADDSSEHFICVYLRHLRATTLETPSPPLE